MIIKYSLSRLSITFLLAIIFPLVQKQWLNLYLFDINNYSIYKILYYLSGVVCPILVILNSINNFTYYKFAIKRVNNSSDIRGKSLFLIISIVLFILSILLSSYFFISLRLLLNLIISNDMSLFSFNINSQIIIFIFFSILLLFKKIKLFFKKASLINFLIISNIIWYLEISNKAINDTFVNDIFKSEYIIFINLLFLLSIEILYYLWSYISNSTYLSDWSLPKPYKYEIMAIFNIILFYLFIFLYYYLLF